MTKPPRNRRTQVSIGQGMAVIAVLAAALALARLHAATALSLAGGVSALIPIIVLAKILLDLFDALFGIPCPGCAHWTLRRLARARRYYRCSTCGMRLKRSGLVTWLDASGPDYDAIYRGKSGARRWLGFAIPENPGDTTTGSLLRDQRRRREASVPNIVDTTLLHWKSRARSWLGLATTPPRGETTGTLLQNQRRRRAGPVPVPKDAKEPIPQEHPNATS